MHCSSQRVKRWRIASDSAIGWCFFAVYFYAVFNCMHCGSQRVKKVKDCQSVTVRPVPGLPSTTSNRFTSFLPKIYFPLAKIIWNISSCHILPISSYLWEGSQSLYGQEIFPSWCTANCHIYPCLPLPYPANIYFLSLLPKSIPAITGPGPCMSLPSELPYSAHISFTQISSPCQDQSPATAAI